MEKTTQKDCFTLSLGVALGFLEHFLKTDCDFSDGIYGQVPDEKVAPYLALLSALAEVAPTDCDGDITYTDEDKKIISDGLEFARFNASLRLEGYTDEEKKEIFRNKSSARFVCKVKSDCGGRMRYVFLAEVNGVKRLCNFAEDACINIFGKVKAEPEFKSWFEVS